VSVPFSDDLRHAREARRRSLTDVEVWEQNARKRPPIRGDELWREIERVRHAEALIALLDEPQTERAREPKRHPPRLEARVGATLVWQDGDRVLFDCPLCGQAGRLTPIGRSRLALDCFADCAEENVVQALDLDALVGELVALEGGTW
jgi:hypothetical protein